MISIKPAGADEWRRFFFTSKDGSGRNFWQTACFSVIDGASYKLFRGAAIASTSAAASALITTSENHGYHVGQKIRLTGLPYEVDGLNDEFYVLTVPSATTFTVGFDTSALSATAGVGLTGADIGSSILVADYGIVEGQKVKDAYLEFWQLPLEG